ncbi:hypothetical protein EDD21DRAFT_131711 [Dissophora ornata]|nr:hypothetical protein EDD21DRAFT_131711 [Dissophora ornata]
MSRIEHTATEGLTTSSLATTPAGSRASSVAPPSFGVVLVNSKKDNDLESGGNGKSRIGAAAGSKEEQDTTGNVNGKSSPQLEDVGHHVCMSKRQCDRHVGWQKLKAAELDLEKTLQVRILFISISLFQMHFCTVLTRNVTLLEQVTQVPEGRG